MRLIWPLLLSEYPEVFTDRNGVLWDAICSHLKSTILNSKMNKHFAQSGLMYLLLSFQTLLWIEKKAMSEYWGMYLILSVRDFMKSNWSISSPVRYLYCLLPCLLIYPCSQTQRDNTLENPLKSLALSLENENKRFKIIYMVLITIVNYWKQ